ncbi:MAG: FMN-binding protein [Spirochaetaceae bacterium]|nr:MAG: FMN-binding protein [Spirochaetaceae bacterium]
MNKQSLVYTIVFTFAVCFVFVAILAVANDLTAEQVRQNQIVAQQRAVLNAMGISYQSDEEVLSLFEDVEQEEIDGTIVYITEKDGNRIYAMSFRGGGVWGPIVGILAMDSSLENIFGIEIISHEETPGLGGRITEEQWKEQFRDRPVPDGSIDVVRGGSTGDGQVAAISGATGTSNSMERILNNAMERFRELLGGRDA